MKDTYYVLSVKNEHNTFTDKVFTSNLDIKVINRGFGGPKKGKDETSDYSLYLNIAYI